MKTRREQGKGGIRTLLKELGLEREIVSVPTSLAATRCYNHFLFRFRENENEYRQFYEALLDDEKKTKCLLDYKEMAEGNGYFEKDDRHRLFTLNFKSWVTRIGYRGIWECAKKALDTVRSEEQEAK